MQNSRWRNAFCISQCYLEADQWRFETIDYEKADNQPKLPFL
jgi:hypothetical protein